MSEWIYKYNIVKLRTHCQNICNNRKTVALNKFCEVHHTHTQRKKKNVGIQLSVINFGFLSNFAYFFFISLDYKNETPVISSLLKLSSAINYFNEFITTWIQYLSSAYFPPSIFFDTQFGWFTSDYRFNLNFFLNGYL